METIAVVVLAFYAVGYFVLGGADIGAGMLLPILARGPAERRLMVAAIVPFFLANEVWLIATAGILVGLFPRLEGALLSGLFPLFVALLAGWVTRDMGLWFRGRMDGDRAGAWAWRATCDGAITLGSWVVAGSWSWIFAGLIAGYPYGVITEPAAAVAVLALLAVFALHGMAFTGLRVSGDLRERLARWLGTGTRGGFTITSAVMTGVVLVAGSNLALTGSAASKATLDWLVPAMMIVTPVLLLAQAWTWKLFGHRLPV